MKIFHFQGKTDYFQHENNRFFICLFQKQFINLQQKKNIYAIILHYKHI